MPKRFSKRKLQLVDTKTNRPVHPQPTSSETYNPYAVIVPSTSVFLLELTVNTCRKKERPPTTLVAILNVRARSRGHASTNQTFFASEITVTIGYKNGQLLRLRVTWSLPGRHILVPRAHDPFGLRQGSRPLAGTEAGSPRITDFRLLCAASEI